MRRLFRHVSRRPEWLMVSVRQIALLQVPHKRSDHRVGLRLVHHLVESACVAITIKSAFLEIASSRIPLAGSAQGVVVSTSRPLSCPGVLTEGEICWAAREIN